MGRLLPLAVLAGLLAGPFACSAERLGATTGNTGGIFGTTGGTAGAGGVAGMGGVAGIAGGAKSTGGYPGAAGAGGIKFRPPADASSPATDGSFDSSYDAAPCDGQVPCCWDAGCPLLL